MAHLLIVDNDARIVELTQWFLERAGHVVDTALSYAEGRQCIARRTPELMLADLDLGIENGRDELPRLASEGLLPPTLVVSGFLDGELEKELLCIPGVRSTLTKPVDLEELLRRIDQALEAGDDVSEEARAGTSVAGASLDRVIETGTAAAEPRPGELAEPSPLASSPHVEPTPVEGRAEEEPDEEGWVEIVPLDPRVVPKAETPEGAPRDRSDEGAPNSQGGA